MSSQLHQHRELLDQILDQLIPANPSKSIPAAGSIGVGDFIEARAVENQQIADSLNQLLLNAAKMNVAVNPKMVEELEASNTASFTVLLNLTYMGYYSRPDIRSLVGVGSWPVHPKGYDVPLEPIDMIQKLTAPVRDRGVMYRNPTNESQVSSE